MRIALSAMNCSDTGVSESFVAYNWLRQIARLNQVDLITAETCPPKVDNVTSHYASKDFWPMRFVSKAFQTSVKPDYFVFDRRSLRHFDNVVSKCDIFHHVVPQAPRYPSGLGCRARRFVLGPIGGGLRVPPAFRPLVEKNEPLFTKLRRMDSLRFRYDPWLKATYDSADLILLTASYMLDVIPTKYHQKVDLLPETGIDADAYSLESFRRTSESQVAILYVGRITPYKGLEFLIRAFANLPPELRTKTTLDIIGEGEADYENRCQTIANNLHVNKQIRFHGRLKKDEVMQHYRQSDIFAFPTLAETTGNVLLEAMAMGLPVVSTNFGGPSDVVDSESGILIAPDNPDSFVRGLSRALHRLITNREHRVSFGANAQQRVFSKFSWHAKGVQINKIYEGLLADT